MNRFTLYARYGPASAGLSRSVSIRNSTIAHNGGDGIINNFIISIANSTVARNGGTGLLNFSGEVVVTNSIIALNQENVLDGGTFTCSFNLIAGNPKLGPLADNGGPTMTMKLLPDSPAINAGDPAFAPPPAFDQRGFPFKRVIGGRVDIGAFEFATRAQMAAQLMALVSELPLNHGHQNALSVKLNLKGNNGDAGKVGAFINQIEAFVGNGKLTAAQADPILDLAEFLLSELA